MAILQKGYTIVFEGADYLLVGVDFSEMSAEAPKEISYEGKMYDIGMLEAVGDKFSSTYCSVRRYDLSKRKCPITILREALQECIDHELSLEAGGDLGTYDVSDLPHIKNAYRALDQTKGTEE